MSEQWRRIQIPDPDGDSGWLLIPPDESPAVGPVWADEQFINHLVYCLNLEQTAQDVGMSIPVPEPEHYDIIFTPAPKRKPRAPKRKTGGTNAEKP